VTDTARKLEELSAMELDAVATMWKRERRTLHTSFGGTSMLPTIAPGQPVIVHCGVEPAVGDIAVFRLSNHIGVHRVVARSATWILTWGDANPLPDDPVLTSCVIGAIRGVPPTPWSLRRALLLRTLVTAAVSIEVLTRRVRFAYQVSSVWSQGPLIFSVRAARAIFRRLFARHRPAKARTDRAADKADSSSGNPRYL
jgi:hypothetical protein